MASVYQRVLGERFTELDPRLQRYFGEIPQGSLGRGEGVYAEAGSRHRWLRPVLAWMAWRRILFPERGTDVPFSIVNIPGADGSLSAERRFALPGRERMMVDTMRVQGGRLVDRLGRRRGLEVALELRVHEGGLRMRSRALALRLGPLRLPLPPLATITLDERTSPDDPERQRVHVRITAPLLGEVFVYRGDFAYAVAVARA